MSKYAAHPSMRWTISINAALTYLSKKRLVGSAVADTIIKHNRDYPDKPIVQLTLRPALITDDELEELDS